MEEQDKKNTNLEKKVTVEPKKKGNNNNILIIIIVVVLIAIIAYVLFLADSPKKPIDKMFQEIVRGDYNQDILSGMLNEENLDKEAQKLLFEKLQWKFLSTKQEGDKATVEVQITNKDFKTIIENYMKKVINVAVTGQDLDNNQLMNYLVDELKNEEIQTVKVQESITVEKKDGKWQIAEDTNIEKIILPGFYEAIQQYNN